MSLFERIAETVNADLELENRWSGPRPGEDPFRDGTADLGWICSTSFVDLATRSANPSVRIAGVAWVPNDPDVGGEPRYFGDLLVRANSDVQSLGDLAGCSIGCNDVVSLSGHYALRKAMLDFGVDPDDFAEMRFTGGHHSSLDQLLAGELDAAVIDSVVRTNRAIAEPKVAGLRVVDRLGPWPVQPLVARIDLDDEIVKAVRDALLQSNDDEAMQRELAAASLTNFVPVEAGHYEPVRSLLDSMA